MKSFAANCTLPTSAANFVSTPNTRGTLDILWSSLNTLLLCTWTIQHLNILVQSRPRTRVQKLRRKFWIYRSKVKWMVTTLLAPEYLIGKTFVDFLSAWHLREEMRVWAERDGVDWTISHVFFANMGGFCSEDWRWGGRTDSWASLWRCGVVAAGKG